MKGKRTANRQKNYIDLLKAMSSVIIMIYHYRHLSLFDPSWPADAELPLMRGFGAIYQYGYLAVELFFVLSGFGFVQKYRFSMEKECSLGKFIGARMVKLYPEFFVTMLLCILLQYAAYYTTGSFCMGLANLTLVDIYLSLAVLQGGIVASRVPFNVPLWFMTPLLICYILFWCIFYRKDTGKNLQHKWFICGVLAGVGLIALWNDWQAAIFNERLMRGIYSFFFGVLLAAFCASSGGSRRVNAVCGSIVAILSIIMVGIGRGGKLTISSVPIFCAVIFAIENSNWIEHTLSLNPVKLLYAPVKKRSYSLFCSHYVVLTGIVYLNRFVNLSKYYDTVWFFLWYCALSFALAAVVNKIGRRLTLKSQYCIQDGFIPPPPRLNVWGRIVIGIHEEFACASFMDAVHFPKNCMLCKLGKKWHTAGTSTF